MDEEGSIQAAVLRLLQSKECSFRDVVNNLAERKLDEAAIKAAVFRLSSEGQIEITSEWKIRRTLRRQGL